MRTADWAKARVSLIAEGDSESITASTAAKYGDDETEVDADAAGAFPSTGAGATTIAADGSIYGTFYGDIDRTYQLIDLGVSVSNTGGVTRMEHIRLTLIVDVSEEA